jgi:hypothetical protein
MSFEASYLYLLKNLAVESLRCEMHCAVPTTPATSTKKHAGSFREQILTQLLLAKDHHDLSHRPVVCLGGVLLLSLPLSVRCGPCVIVLLLIHASKFHLAYCLLVLLWMHNP